MESVLKHSAPTLPSIIRIGLLSAGASLLVMAGLYANQINTIAQICFPFAPVGTPFEYAGVIGMAAVSAALFTVARFPKKFGI